MSDAVRRAVRSFIQVGLVQAFIGLYQAFAHQPLTPEQVMAITAVATPIVALVQNLLEDHTDFPAILKAPASEGQNPTPAST